MKAITKSVSFASHHRTYLFSAAVTEDPPGKFDISLLSFVVARQVSTFPKDSLCLGFRAGIYKCFYDHTIKMQRCWAIKKFFLQDSASGKDQLCSEHDSKESEKLSH